MLTIDKKDHLFNTVIYILLSIFVVLIIVPLLFIIANSISSPSLVFQNKVGLIPQKIDLTVFKIVLSNAYILRGFGNTILYTFLGTLISVTLTLTASYPLSRKDFKHRKFLNLIFIITMFFSGGMIPSYLVVDGLGLKDTIWGFILPGCLSVWNIMVCKSFIYQAIPNELLDAAKIDGCSDAQIFFSIMLPLCKPIIAIMVLFYAVGYWNSYFNSLLYLSDPKLYPLQRILSDIIIQNDLTSMVGTSGSLENQGQLVKSIQYVTIIVSSAPILLLYPFIQKYFQQGMLLGSIKE
ncbi:MAG: carbohydrate ABC transporter permease [Bacillales bacterium]|jgi:putative aldouronate transport system permease protein|nr:carbohydrate ABC transporter permease [Bacillales bacterium]